VPNAKLEAGAVRRAQARLGRPPQHGDAPELRADCVSGVGRAVGAVVVDDEDVYVGRGSSNTTKHRLYVRSLR